MATVAEPTVWDRSKVEDATTNHRGNCEGKRNPTHHLEILRFKLSCGRRDDGRVQVECEHQTLVFGNRRLEATERWISSVRAKPNLQGATGIGAKRVPSPIQPSGIIDRHSMMVPRFRRNQTKFTRSERTDNRSESSGSARRSQTIVCESNFGAR